MSLSIINSLALVGASAPRVSVEVFLGRGLPSFSIVGLAETAVKESRDRVRGAIINSGFDFPNRRIIVNLAPADLPKEGGRFDLPIAMGLLAASGQVPAAALAGHIFLGELALSGELRDVRGALIAAVAARDSGQVLALPAASAPQANLVRGVDIKCATTLGEMCRRFDENGEWPDPEPLALPDNPRPQPDMAEVSGQAFAKYALEIAACGAHNTLMLGPPGTGKTMLASRMPGILPEMSEEEALESAANASLVQRNWPDENWKRRPFRAPHHGASSAALIGGGAVPRPGEISLAHNGVLFLDELTEFERRSLELLREPMESGNINISRVAFKIQYLARFMLVAAANPCRCGYLGDASGKCRCTPDQVQRYLSKLSGPLLDRIDVQLYVNRIPVKDMQEADAAAESSATIRERVQAARAVQLERQGRLNSELGGEDMKRFCALDGKSRKFLERVVQNHELSNRSYHRILRLARTIADHHGEDGIAPRHLAGAVKLRCMEQEFPGAR